MTVGHSAAGVSYTDIRK